MSSNISIGKSVITKALAGKSKGLVYFLHGACDNGKGCKYWIDHTINGKFAFQNFPVLYPSSPIKSYSLHEGKKEYIWFDQLALNPNFPEDYGTISALCVKLNEMIKKDEANTGVPREKVIVGGFQMGGAMALHLGYKFNTNIAGVFALSSFLPPDSLLYDAMDMHISMKSSEMPCKDAEDLRDAYEIALGHVKFPKLFMSHGANDPIIPLRWGKNTFTDLRKRGVDGHFYTIANGNHSVNKQQLGLLHDWIHDTLYKDDDDNTENPPPSDPGPINHKFRSRDTFDHSC